MLVDLARNDVGRVVEFGSLQIDEMMTLEKYSHVMHLTSQVSGALAEGRTTRSTCCGRRIPAGTLSGAPKVRAMEIIDELEPVKRGPYGGVVGYLDFSGNIDTAITIRTMLVSDGQGVDPGRRWGGGRLRRRRRTPRVPEQGEGAARCGPRRAPHDRRPQGGPGMTIRETVRVSGPDASAYLQGQISQDVDALGPGDVAWSLVLQPTGKVDAWFRIQRLDDETFLLDVDAGHRDTLVARLRRFLLRTDAVIEPVDSTIDAPVEWPGVADPTDERQRILAGMPRMGTELTADTIPGEGGQRLIDLSVSFTKGCYTGQELVARIDSRGGNVPRPVRILQADADVSIGDEVTADSGDVVGVVTSAAGDVALAPLKRAVEIGDRVAVAGVAASVIEPAGS